MNTMPLNESGGITLRSILVVAAAYLALAVGLPWLLTDAPPSAQDVLVRQVCCAGVSPPAALKLPAKASGQDAVGRQTKTRSIPPWVARST